MKYIRSNDNNFFNGLRSEVDNYFKCKKINKYGNHSIVMKGVILLSVYAASYACILLLPPHGIFLMPAYLLMGISGVMIVFNVVHDASHGAFSKIKLVNKCICYIGDLVGINTYIWNIRHNIQHHAFTNVLGGDLVIENIPLIRLSPQQPYKKFHAYQVFYAPLFYTLYSLYWIFVIDFRLFFKRDICNLHNLKHPAGEWMILIFSKVFYIFYLIVIPLLFTSLSFLSVLGYFLIMHLAAGLLLSIIAVMGHFVEGPSFPDAPGGLIENSWSEHELDTTIDFAPKSKIVNWITGGLNTHVAHHLFPNVCHVHYYELTRIIENYCSKYRYDYKKESLGGGILSHIRYLKKMSAPLESKEKVKNV
jgi:linoleoyl-CoA desaturase